MQRTRTLDGPIICMLTTLQNMEHHIRTIYRDSTNGFSGMLWAVPWQGVGQGNGTGPQIWALASTPVLNMLREAGCGAIFKTAVSGSTVTFVGYAFVDDTDLIAASPDPNATYLEVTTLMQNSITAWEGGIRATGRALVPEKTHWYLIDFKWTQGKWEYATAEDAPAKLYMRDSEGQLHKIQRLSINQAERTLGVRLAPNGNNAAQIKHMTNQAAEWGECLQTGLLSKALAWQAMHTTIIKSLKYPLPATTMTKEECEGIMGTMLCYGLPKAGIFRYMPKDLVFGPLRYPGFAVPHLYVVQQLCHIEDLIRL